MRRFPALSAGLTALFAILLLSIVGTAPPAPTPAPVHAVDVGRLALAFETNSGQTDPAVRYLAHVPGGAIFFTSNTVVLARDEESGSGDRAVGMSGASSTSAAARRPQPSVLVVQWLGANPAPTLASGALQPGRVNYLHGNDPARWQTNLPTYTGVTYQALYPGVDLAYSGTGRQLEGTYVLAPGADPAAIRWQYECGWRGPEGTPDCGLDGVRVQTDELGNLQIALPQARDANSASRNSQSAVRIQEAAPVAWQEIGGRRVPVAVHYVVAADGSVGFALGAYDRSQPLTIDPTLTYSTYLGGTQNDIANAIAVDTAGSAYVAGYTSSPDFPLHTPYQPTCHCAAFGIPDVFVAKLNPAGTALVYATYLGGTDYDFAYAIAVDASGAAYIAGMTQSYDFPLQNPYQPSYDAAEDAFLTKLSPSGAALVYSTYLGGDNLDQANGVAVDAVGNAYVAGITGSTNFPLHNAYRAVGDGSEGFVTKFNAAGSALLYSTYLGGADYDQAAAIAVDATGAAYVTGETASYDFPVLHAFEPVAHGGNSNAYVTKFTPSGTALAYSSFLSGAGANYGFGIAVDSAGAAYVTGQTAAPNFPLVHPIQAVLGVAGYTDAFVSKVSPDGGSLVYSTFLGGTLGDQGNAIAVDRAGNAYVAGYTASSDFPRVAPIQPSFAGAEDAFLTKLDAAGGAWTYSTYLGGIDVDAAQGVAVDAGGGAYVTGYTNSANFPLAGTPVQPTFGANNDAFVVKVVAPTVTGTPPTATPAATSTRTPQPTPTVCGLAWRAVPSVDLAGLTGVAAPGASDVWAGGASGVMHWDGFTWTETRIPRSNALGSVAAGAPNAVWTTDGGILQWNGSAWIRPSYYMPLDSTGGYSDVTAGGPTSVWAIGSFVQYYDFGFGVVLHWNGQAWTQIAAPLPKGGAPGAARKQAPAGGCYQIDSYQAIDAVGPNDAWLTGHHETNCVPNANYDFVQHCTATNCNGPEQGFHPAGFAGVAPDDVWAFSGTFGPPAQSLMYHLVGTTWTPVTVPGAGVLLSATTLTADDIWVLGSLGILHWDGSGWFKVDGPLLPAHPAAIAAAGPDDIWVVGSDAGGHSAITHYSNQPLFADVPAAQPFFSPIQALACRSILSGYTCGGPGEPCNPLRQPYFRAGFTITRGQIAKVVAVSAGLTGTPTTQTFHDVPPGSPFYRWIEQMASRGYLSGYTCGGSGEPCDSQHRPYFRPYLAVTRAQIAKAVALAAGYAETPTTQTFHDVPATQPFYRWIEQLATRHLISGYACGGAGLPCDSQQRPYFRPDGHATRGQTAKIVSLALPGVGNGAPLRPSP